MAATVEALQARVDVHEKVLDKHEEKINELFITDTEQLTTSAHIQKALQDLRIKIDETAKKSDDLGVEHRFFKYVLHTLFMLLIFCSTVDHETWAKFVSGLVDKFF